MNKEHRKHRNDHGQLNDCRFTVWNKRAGESCLVGGASQAFSPSGRNSIRSGDAIQHKNWEQEADDDRRDAGNRIVATLRGKCVHLEPLA